MLKSRERAIKKLKSKLKEKNNNNNNKNKKEEEEIIIFDDDNDFVTNNNKNKNSNINSETTGNNNNNRNQKQDTLKDIINSSIIENGLSVDDNNNNKRYRKRKLIYCDYNLSEIVDTKGGFLIEKTEEDLLKDKEPEKKVKHLLPIDLELQNNPKCQECDSLDIDYNYLDNFNVKVCRNCRTKMPEKYSLLTKTECKEDYLLTDSELRDRELLPCWERPNPHKSSWNNMMLFVRYQVEEYAFKKWGSEQGLDEEFDRRETEKRQRQEKKFNAKLKELRRKTRTSIWLKEKAKAHVHEFGETVVNESGESVHRCKTCGYLEEFEEF
ncbi:DNA repair protein [Anaeromyces robustus]|uniref:DNA repair protein RAD14 n=1 Tax=Anaeromyces robustus TaxID=1754192 RepID=A0A1Y1W8J0_9FUNG|nr:DNA repair protein [Anaeromyces robustus]|eukprot:ORX69823.1 DNA repair protein [Anaeromyces robustus]